MVEEAALSVTPEAIVQGVLAFVEQIAVPSEVELGERLHNPRLRFLENGREAPAVVEARRHVRTASASAGYYSMFCPMEIGGAGLGSLSYYHVIETLYQHYGPGDRLAYNVLAHWASGPSGIWSLVSPELAATVRPRVMRGELLGSFGMSEPDAGSDAWRMKTAAVRDGDSWVINGSKQWTSFAPTADYCLVMAVTDAEQAAKRRSGITCFYVPLATAGFVVESVLALFGELGGNESILSLQDVRVPLENVIGEPGRGFDLGMLNVTTGRLYNTARAVGIGRWALQKALGYARLRSTFGKRLEEHQTIQNMLADCAVEIYTARLAGMDLARRADAGESLRRDAAMAKLYATNAAWRVVDRVIQIHGAMGLTNEVGLYEAMHRVRSTRIADGTDEILRRTIARELVNGNTGF